MAADGQIIYNFSTINGAVEAIDTAIASMRGTLGKLEQDLRPLETDAWTSEAQQAYKVRKDRWTTASGDIVLTLGKVRAALVTAAERMDGVDKKAVGYFNR
jgi:6 kDa early secretory antigenic target